MKAIAKKRAKAIWTTFRTLMIVEGLYLGAIKVRPRNAKMVIATAPQA